VLFADCDVIHDKGREWMLRVYHCDAARVADVRFENVTVNGRAVTHADVERNAFVRGVAIVPGPAALAHAPVLQCRGRPKA
jgi:hypothetical protein